MEDLLTIKTVGCLRLVIAAGIFFVWIPRKILPQEYLDNRLDRFMYNALHMSALATLIFPIFIALRCFGFPFLCLFLVVLRLLVLKFWYRRELWSYLRNELYHGAIVWTLRTLDDPGALRRRVQPRLADRLQSLTDALHSPERWWAPAVATLVAAYALFIRLSAVFSTMVPTVSDTYQYYYWNQILKLNVLFDKVAGAPYPWGSPVLVRTVNFLAGLNTVVLYGTFPVLVLGFSFFSLYYFCRKTLEPEDRHSPAPLLALVLFAIVIPSPLAGQFFGDIYGTVAPVVSHLGGLGVIASGPGPHDKLFSSYNQVFFVRHSALLPYEVATSFLLLALHFLHRALVTRRTMFLLLYAETLAVISALHPGVLIVLFPASLLVTVRALVSCGLDSRTFTRGCAALAAGLALGNLWLVQLAVYGVPEDIGAAAPFLDKLFHTRRALRDTSHLGIPELQLVSPTLLQGILLLGALVLLVASFRARNREQAVARSVIPLFVVGTLTLYFATNLGLPRLVDHSRIQSALALSYGLTLAQGYLQIVEEGVLQRFWQDHWLKISRLAVGSLAALAILAAPRFIDNQGYQRSTTEMELPESSYYLYKIEDTFQPFSYTVVSYLEGFSLVVSHGYHMNTQDLLTSCSPYKSKIDIPSQLVFIFVENAPVPYRGSGEFWYRWRGDIQLKLKDWIVLYGANHDNLRLWKQGKHLQIYLIDNSNFRENEALTWRRDTGSGTEAAGSRRTFWATLQESKQHTMP